MDDIESDSLDAKRYRQLRQLVCVQITVEQIVSESGNWVNRGGKATITATTALPPFPAGPEDLDKMAHAEKLDAVLDLSGQRS
jgi:hypothetical protein